MLTTEPLQTQRQSLILQEEQLKNDTLVAASANLVSAERELEIAQKHQEEASKAVAAIVKPYQQKIHDYNEARIQLMLQLQFENGLVWDSLEKAFLPKEVDETFYSLQLKIGDRIDYDDFEETWTLYQTPSRERRDDRCWAAPWNGFELPVILVDSSPHTEPDGRWDGWNREFGIFRGQVYRQLDEGHTNWLLPDEVPEQLAKQYGIPPELPIFDLEKLRQVLV